jgi:uncharacterized membrane protein
VSVVRRYPHFVAFVFVTALVGVGLAAVIHPARALLAGFDCGVLAFLVLVVFRMGPGTAATMRSRAARNEPDHHSLTAIALFVVAVVLVAVWVELSGDGGHHASGIALAAATLSLAWLFANILFALHYAHLYYLPDMARSGGDRGGLDFPGRADGVDAGPDYWDFAYFAVIIGMTFQVSDVAITAKPIRRLALLHAMLAFLFNIGVIALSVSLVGSVLGS